MALFDGMAGTPGHVLQEVVRLASSRLAGRRVEVRVAGAVVHLTVERIDLEGVGDDLAAATDDLLEVAIRLGDSAWRNAMDPLAFGRDAFEAVASAIDRALSATAGRAIRGEVEIASAATLRLVDVVADADAPGTHTAALDVVPDADPDADASGTHTASLDARSGPITGHLADGFTVVVADVALTARIRADSLVGWLRRLGVDLGPATDVEAGDDGVLRLAVGRRRLGPLGRLARLVVAPGVEHGMLVLDADAVEIVGRRIRLPARLRRRMVVDPASIRNDLELRDVTVSASEVAVRGWLPGLVQPVAFEQFDDLLGRLARPGAEQVEMRLTRPGPTPGTPGTPRASPASGTR